MPSCRSRHPYWRCGACGKPWCGSLRYGDAVSPESEQQTLRLLDEAMADVLHASRTRILTSSLIRQIIRRALMQAWELGRAYDSDATPVRTVDPRTL